jgi:ATP-dependent Zn protease
LSPTDRERTAYHEAGHAVLHHHFGHRIQSVTIEAAGSTLGLTRVNRELDFSGDALDRDEVEKELIIALAGERSEEIAFRQPPDFGLDQDRETADRLLEQFPVDIGDEIYDSAFRRSRELLEERWTSVQKLAHALLKRATLSAEDVRRTLG